MCLFLMQGTLELEKFRGEEGESASSAVAPVSLRRCERVRVERQTVIGRVSVELRGQAWVERAESWLVNGHLGRGVAAVSREQVYSETREEPR